MTPHNHNRRDDDEEAPEPALREWERRAVASLIGLLVTAFLAWAGVVWHGTTEVVAEMRAVRQELAEQALADAEYRTLLERRITIVEQRQKFTLATLQRLGERLTLEEDDEDERNGGN